MSLSYTHEFRLNGLDVDGRGICKPSALLNHLQNAATLAAEEGGFDRELMMERYGAFWMLARSWFRLDRPLRFEDRLSVRTWHRGGKSAVMYRDYDILANGEPVGESVSAWVMAEMATRRIVKLSGVKELEGTDGGELCKTKQLSRLRVPADMSLAERRPMRYSESDINGHINNTRYADFACDVLDMAALEESSFLSAMEIGYLAECRPGEVLDLFAGERDGLYYVRGVGTEGTDRFTAAMGFASLG